MAAVRSRALDDSLPSAPALQHIFRPKCVASRLLFSGVCGAFCPVGHRLSHVGERLCEDAPDPANYGVCWEPDRACDWLCYSHLRVGSVVTTARYRPRTTGEKGLDLENWSHSRRSFGHGRRSIARGGTREPAWQRLEVHLE